MGNRYNMPMFNGPGFGTNQTGSYGPVMPGAVTKPGAKLTPGRAKPATGGAASPITKKVSTKPSDRPMARAMDQAKKAAIPKSTGVPKIPKAVPKGIGKVSRIIKPKTGMK